MSARQPGSRCRTNIQKISGRNLNLLIEWRVTNIVLIAALLGSFLTQHHFAVYETRRADSEIGVLIALDLFVERLAQNNREGGSPIM